jgi:hypothetical protein
LELKGINFLKTEPLNEHETHGRTGTHKAKRRDPRKTLSDLRVVMGYITERVDEAGARPDVITLLTVDTMFTVLADKFVGVRNAQKKWNTTAEGIRKVQKDRRQRHAALQ